MFTIENLIQACKGVCLCQGPVKNFAGVSIDSRHFQTNQIFIALKGERFDGHDFVQHVFIKGLRCALIESRNPKKAEIIKTAKQTGSSVIVVSDTIKALGDLARWRRLEQNIPVIFVTGSNGKTTTKDILSWILDDQGSVLKTEGTKNNHIGLPLTLLKMNKRHSAVVLEAGTNHPGEIAYLADIARPNIGVITEVGASHLEFFKTEKAVFQEKLSFVPFMQNPRVMVVNADNRFLSRICKSKKAKQLVLGYGVNCTCDFSALVAQQSNTQIEFYLNSSCDKKHLRKINFTLNTPGYYNVYNALGAIAVARVLGKSYQHIQKRLAAFSFPSGRLNVKTVRGITIIDDTYNANPVSMRAGLDTLAQLKTHGRKICVLGDMRELGTGSEFFHKDIGVYAAKKCDVLVCVGSWAKVMALAAQKAGLLKKNIFVCLDADQAYEIVSSSVKLQQNDTILIKGSRAMGLEAVVLKL